MKVVAVVQARMASTRLPGKVLTRLGNKTAIEWVTDAAKAAPGVDQVIVGTSTNKENDTIEKWCRYHDVDCSRGSEDDVLDRYNGIIVATGADAIVRLTGDCPLLDPHVIGEVIARFKATGADYCSNISPPTYPDGLDVECILSWALLEAAAKATRLTDRDTVTQYIARNRATYNAQNVTCNVPGLWKERWVLDSPEDLTFLKAVIAELPDRWRSNYLDVLAVLEKQPELRKLNNKYQRNERFYESLAREVIIPRSFENTKKALSRAEKTIPMGAQTFSKSKYQFSSHDTPLFVTHGDGGCVYDVDGNDYVDMVSALLPNVLGYRDPDVDFSIRSQLDSGISFSLANELEAELSERLVRHIPCAEMVKLGKNGSDVTSAAVRVARAYTGRMTVLKSGYHGWNDWSVEGTSRQLGSCAHSSFEVKANDLDLIEQHFKQDRVAAIIVEPDTWTQKNLRELKILCSKFCVLLIFDEVITGFRWSIGGYQKHIGITPDLACFGKAMANGMPISALVGSKDIMKRFDPPDNIFYSGTFFGETLSIAAAIATIDKIERENVIRKLWDTGSLLMHGARTRIKDHGLQEVIKLKGDEPRVMINFSGIDGVSPELLKVAFIREMANAGVLIIGSHNVCYAHSESDMQRTLKAYDHVLGFMAEAIKDGNKSDQFTKTTASGIVQIRGS